MLNARPQLMIAIDVYGEVEVTKGTTGFMLGKHLAKYFAHRTSVNIPIGIGMEPGGVVCTPTRSVRTVFEAIDSIDEKVVPYVDKPHDFKHIKAIVDAMDGIPNLLLFTDYCVECHDIEKYVDLRESIEKRGGSVFMVFFDCGATDMIKETHKKFSTFHHVYGTVGAAKMWLVDTVMPVLHKDVNRLLSYTLQQK